MNERERDPNELPVAYMIESDEYYDQFLCRICAEEYCHGHQDEVGEPYFSDEVTSEDTCDQCGIRVVDIRELNERGV